MSPAVSVAKAKPAVPVRCRIGYTPVTVFDKSVHRNDAMGSDAKQNAFCFHLWHVRVRRPLYRRGTSVTRTLVEPVSSGRCLTLFPSTRSRV
ncbi:hypothetical protein ALC53_05354 [Atta colombica]|uniref:Uncharacterized protein n=1 Tax=Atta colombica TaxID=520822 RepID=A0A195BIS7_9HYME|nr:hypothetical protein ALC53_05354 [Atta colombica]